MTDRPPARPAKGASILADKRHDAPSVFEPRALLREARRQKAMPEADIPPVCVLDPDGDIVRHLRRTGAAQPSPGWACYHTTMTELEVEGTRIGIVDCAVGAPFAVLVAEQAFASGCRLLISITSAGQLVEIARPPYFIAIDRALRDEGTSYHYLPPDEFSYADAALLDTAAHAAVAAGLPMHRGSSWTTDAPFRETADAIERARQAGALAVEMEAAALYAFAIARKHPVVCFAHVTNTMGLIEGDFEKGEADGSAASLRLIAAVVKACLPKLA